MTSRRRFLLATTAAAAGMAACSRPEEKPDDAHPSASTPPSTSSTEPAPPPSPEEIARQRVPADLRARIASLMHVGVRNADDARAKLAEGVGGLFVASWADPRLLYEPGRDLAALRHEAGHRFATSIDFEGGRVQRHQQVLGSFPSARELAATGDTDLVRDTGYTIGLSLRRHGVTVDFAPVLDIDVAALDVIGDRSFSPDPTVVGRFGAAFAEGLNSAGVAPVYKHFPGHGRASGDTHYTQAITPPLEELYSLDLPPFATALARRPAAVMMGHMVVPGLGADGLPSTLDGIAYQLLRTGDYPGGRKFSGLVYTDDLSGMRAISDIFSLPDAVTTAIEAGADQALWSSGAQVAEAIDAVQHAVESGRIPERRIDEAAHRLQLQLYWAGV
ncbi:beta-N-acetylglucosaminidase [Corynebacterium yudongzhengii]|uniref:beta-N-acetylhexosaminidase n=1 Tax=Corynebacterium yudongzhengii TaxID=2080740 RepID=A0A2U1T873_9CORY|nr:glycoside hydrolase family 3 N-terminal domain-containing protein [Corynebacterium yudongzhengii]AWB82758.1 beta-N-acetylglucosaminidase [Corynebacterium yudongzhengii]PWC02182.1 glycoside hydrolase family 3 protein [Corynebacterium yudongzhengii]